MEIPFNRLGLAAGWSSGRVSFFHAFGSGAKHPPGHYAGSMFPEHFEKYGFIMGVSKIFLYGELYRLLILAGRLLHIKDDLIILRYYIAGLVGACFTYFFYSFYTQACLLKDSLYKL